MKPRPRFKLGDSPSLDNEGIKPSNNQKIVSIQCEGDGFRYEYYEGDNQNELITEGFGPLTHNLKFKISGPEIENEFMINDISCTETYDKIISTDFEDDLEENDMFDLTTTLYQYKQNGRYNFETLKLNDKESFDIKRLTGELIIPLGDLFKTPGLKYLIYEKLDGEKVNLKITDGEYNETEWDPVSSTYDLEIEHYISKLSQNQILHSKILFGEDPEQIALDYDDISYIEAVENLVKDTRFTSSFLQSIYKVGIEKWIGEDIANDVLDGFKKNPNTPKSLINAFESKINSNT